MYIRLRMFTCLWAKIFILEQMSLEARGIPLHASISGMDISAVTVTV